MAKLEDNEYLKIKSNYWWLFGRGGCKTRIKIVKCLLERPYNANQLSNKIEMSYRNIMQHLIILKKADIVYTNSKSYGKLYLLKPNFNKILFNKILSKSQGEIKGIIS